MTAIELNEIYEKLRARGMPKVQYLYFETCARGSELCPEWVMRYNYEPDGRDERHVFEGDKSHSISWHDCNWAEDLVTMAAIRWLFKLAREAKDSGEYLEILLWNTWPGTCITQQNEHARKAWKEGSVGKDLAILEAILAAVEATVEESGI